MSDVSFDEMAAAVNAAIDEKLSNLSAAERETFDRAIEANREAMAAWRAREDRIIVTYDEYVDGWQAVWKQALRLAASPEGL